MYLPNYLLSDFRQVICFQESGDLSIELKLGQIKLALARPAAS